jgi:hypothetical protein
MGLIVRRYSLFCFWGKTVTGGSEKLTALFPASGIWRMLVLRGADSIGVVMPGDTEVTLFDNRLLWASALDDGR